jgi:preprotein translocase subunit SecD
MTRLIRLQFVAILLLGLLAAYVLAPSPDKPVLSGVRIVPGIDLAGGAELRYRILHEPGFAGDKAAVARETADILRRRLAGSGLKEPKINAHGDDQIVIQLPGIDEAGLRDAKRFITPMGKLELFATADEDLQDRYRRDGVVPRGTRALGGLLLEESAVVEGRHLLSAQPQLDAGGRWVTEFQLDGEGAKRFDEAAERLYGRRPRGRIAIVLDGKLRSAPTVESPAFHGRGQISSARE